MELKDFAEPTIPFNKWGNDTDEAQIRKWYLAGFLRTNNTRPDFMVDTFALTELGTMDATGIDVNRWPYQCGRMAKIQGKSRDSSGLTVGSRSHRHWAAGWDSVKG